MTTPSAPQLAAPHPSFGPASQAPRAYLTMTNVHPKEWCAAVEARPKVIGRSTRAEIRLSRRFPYVSRRHAEIWDDGERFHLRDLGSTTGTHVNGVWIGPQRIARVALGDRIWIGGVELEMGSHEPPLAQVIAQSPPPGEEQDSATDSELLLQRAGSNRMMQSLLAELSPAEMDVVLWMGRGLVDDPQLGQALGRSPNTIRTQMSSIFQKLDIHSRAEIVAWLKRPK